MQSPDTKVSC